MWTCKKCNSAFEDESMEFCFQCLTVRNNSDPIGSSAEKLKVHEKPSIGLPPPPTPTYIAFLHVFAGLQCVMAILASLLLVLVVVLNNSGRGGGGSTSAWVVLLAIAVEGFVAYGVLNALADIA